MLGGKVRHQQRGVHLVSLDAFVLFEELEAVLERGLEWLIPSCVSHINDRVIFWSVAFQLLSEPKHHALTEHFRAIFFLEIMEVIDDKVGSGVRIRDSIDIEDLPSFEEGFGEASSNFLAEFTATPDQDERLSEPMVWYHTYF